MSESTYVINMERQIVVVMRGPSAAYFRQDEKLFVQDFPSAVGPVNIVYRTRWLTRTQNVSLPGHLWIEVSGSAQNLEDVLVPFANAGLSMLPGLCLSANAAVGEPELEVGFDNTTGITERDYFQSYIPTESEEVHLARVMIAEPSPKGCLRGHNQQKEAHSANSSW